MMQHAFIQEDATTQNGTPKETPDKEVVPAKVTTGGLEGVPALSACQIGIRWIGDATESSRLVLQFGIKTFPLL